jgi:CTP-dependent riboflavin kinase
MIVEGQVKKGQNHFEKRMTEHRAAFENMVGHSLQPGTINVKVGEEIRIKEHLRLKGEEIDHHEDFIFQRCTINGYDGYRIRPIDKYGNGGHGDCVLEISCAVWVPNVGEGADVVVELFD